MCAVRWKKDVVPEEGPSVAWTGLTAAFFPFSSQAALVFLCDTGAEVWIRMPPPHPRAHIFECIVTRERYYLKALQGFGGLVLLK